MPRSLPPSTPTAPARRTRTLAAVLWAMLSTACGSSELSDQASRAPVTTDSAGVTFVAIASADQAFRDTLVEVRRITPADSGLGAFGALWPNGVASNNTDRLYVLASEDAQIVSFDGEGTPLARWGRRGGGPGEFEYGSGLVVDTDGTVGVYDFMRRQLLRFGPDGTVRSPYTLPRDSAGAPDLPIIPRGTSLLFSRRTQENDSVSRSLMLVRDTDTTRVTALTTVLTTDIAFTSCPVRMRGLPPYFSPVMTVAAHPDGWVVQRGSEWRLEFYNERGDLMRVWTRNVSARPTTPDLLDREMRQPFEIQFPGGSCKIPVAEVANTIGMAATLPALRRVAVAPDGTVWAERFEPLRDEQRVDVIAPDGELLGTITGRGAPLAFLQGGRVVFAETDLDTDLMELVVLRVPNAGW